MTRVLIAAPSAVVRAGLASLLAERPTIDVVGSVSPSDLLEKIDKLTPDAVLAEIEEEADLPPLGGGGDEPAAPPAFVLLLATTDESRMTEALRAGARAVLPRDAEPDAIAAAVIAAAAGLVALDPEAAKALLAAVTRAARSDAPPAEPLTPRESEILAMLAEGSGNKQIARRLGISEHTVKFHVGSILAKLGAASRTEAVTLGLRQGLIMV